MLLLTISYFCLQCVIDAGVTMEAAAIFVCRVPSRNRTHVTVPVVNIYCPTIKHAHMVSVLSQGNRFSSDSVVGEFINFMNEWVLIL